VIGMTFGLGCHVVSSGPVAAKPLDRVRPL
jgi:hypothetical protein